MGAKQQIQPVLRSIAADPADVRAEPVQVRKQIGELPTINGSDYRHSPSSPPEKISANSYPESWPKTSAQVNEEVEEEPEAADEDRELGS